MSNLISKYGCINGLILFIGFFASHLLLGDGPENFDTGEITGYSIMLLSSCVIVLGIRKYKLQNDQQLPFLSGIYVGLGISAIASACFALYNLIYLKWLNPDFTATYMVYTEQQIKNSGKAEEIIQQQLAELNQYAEFMSNDYLQSLVMFITVFLIGIVFTVVSSAAMRTKPK